MASQSHRRFSCISHSDEERETSRWSNHLQASVKLKTLVSNLCFFNSYLKQNCTNHLSCCIHYSFFSVCYKNKPIHQLTETCYGICWRRPQRVKATYSTIHVGGVVADKVTGKVCHFLRLTHTTDGDAFTQVCLELTSRVEQAKCFLPWQQAMTSVSYVTQLLLV